MITRDAQRGDLDAIIAIDASVSGVTKPQYWRDTYDAIQQQRGTHFFLVAEHQQAIAGFVIGEIKAWEFGSPPCGWVSTIGVAEEGRLGGVGTKMLEALYGRFRRAGVNTVRTMVARQDHELMSFFRSQGMMGGPYLQLEITLD